MKLSAGAIGRPSRGRNGKDKGVIGKRPSNSQGMVSTA